MPEDITRLPKWAQYRIEEAERRAATAEAALAAWAGERTTVEVARYGVSPRFIEPGALVKFHLASGGYVGVRHDDTETVEVVAQTHPGRLAIFPRVSNSFALREVG